MKVYIFACIEKNIGDDLFIKLLCERYPKVEFVISAQAKYGSLQKIPNLYFSKKLERWLWARSLDPKNPIKKGIAWLLKAMYSIGLSKGDVGICIVGNAFKNMSYTGWSQSAWMRARIRLVRRFYLISTNFGPYNDERWKFDFEKIYSQMTDVCFRDEYSYKLFEHLPNTRFAPDAVISLKTQATCDGCDKRVIISLLDCAFSARSETLHKAAAEYEKTMVDVAKKYLNEGYKVTFLNSNAEQDRPACDRILSQLAFENIEIVDYAGDLETVFELYRNSSCVVATRLHTIVLAWLYRLPVVPIVYDIKVENLLNSYCFSSKRYNIEAMDNISAEDIYYAMEQYDFVLPQDVITSAQLQFKEIDKEFSNYME